MSNKVFANGMELSCKAGKGKSICAFPDVCMTPPENPATPPGVPVPYPNTGMTSDTTSGSKKVKISKKEVMLKNKSYFKKSMGDEAGSAAKKGVVTSVNRGKVFFNAWSMNVKFEGENVVRNLDITTHNHNSPPGNTPPMPFIDGAAPPKKIDSTKKGNLKVSVKDVHTGDSIDGVEVTVGKEKKKTPHVGGVEFKDLLPGAYSIKVYKHFSDADFIRFIIHYPTVTYSGEAVSKTVKSGTVSEGKTADVDVELEVYRVVSPVTFHRRHIDLNGPDKYGHWWTVVAPGESYGWWPKYPMGHPNNASSPPPAPPPSLPENPSSAQKVQHMFSSMVYSAKKALYNVRESSLVSTFAGVEGELNGQTSFGGSATRDPHEIGNDAGDDQYQPVVNDDRTDSDIQDALRDYAKSFAANNTTWSWRFEAGNHCHTFQKLSMIECKLDKFKEL